jgi:putative flippase GtrA
MPAAAVAKDALGGQAVRYVINGLLATAVHYGVLRFNIEVLHIPLAAVANACSGLRHPPYRSSAAATSFSMAGRAAWRGGAAVLLIYAAIAVLHALVMYVWADRSGLDYRIGFVLATGMQMAFSFVANKFLVFK